MTALLSIVMEKRGMRHLLFWAAWVIGFTWIKSFGHGFDMYISWLTYYMITLPLFMVHTYMVVYWLGNRFLYGPGIILFVMIFIVLVYIFSYLELLITSEILGRWFPEIFHNEPIYRNPERVLISGVGNLYVLLVFTAVRMIRNWFRGGREQQLMIHANLMMERADANASMQPGMLLYSINEIRRDHVTTPDDTPGFLAMLSELMNHVMNAHQSVHIRLDEEIRNVRKLLHFYGALHNLEPPHLYIQGQNLSRCMVPASILFSPLEILFRKHDFFQCKDFEIVAGEDQKLQIKWKQNRYRQTQQILPGLKSELNALYPSRFEIRIIQGDYYMGIELVEKSG